MRCCATCRGHRSPHWHRSRFSSQRRSPSWWAAFVDHGIGRAGGLRRGRCKYVHVSSVAASMRLTPLRSPPARPRTVSVHVHHGKEREDQKRKRIASLRSLGAKHGSTLENVRARKTVEGGVGGVGGGWGARMRGPHHPGRFKRRPPPPPPPTPPTRSNPAVAVAVALLPLQVQGCKPCQNTYVAQPAITSRARIASHSSSIRHTRLIASRRSGSRCHTGNSPASV